MLFLPRAFWRLAALLGIGLTTAPTLAETPKDRPSVAPALQISGSYRMRYETLAGQARAGLNAQDEQLAVRATLFAEYRTPRFRIGAELYDSRAYLGVTGSAVSANDVNSLEPVQAYVAGNFDGAMGAGTKTSLQLGRFLLNLGSRRIIAADDYRNATNSYTGARADLTWRSGATTTLIYTLPQVRLPDDLPSILNNKARLDKESFNLRLWGGLFTQPQMIGNTALDVSYVRLQERDAPDRPTRDRNLHVLGARLIRDPDARNWDYEIEGMYQFGHSSVGTSPLAARLPVKASFLHVDLGYSFAIPAKLRLSAEYDYASGDRGGGKYSRFDTLFGMRRADFGPAGIYAAIGRSNISTAGLRAEIAPNKWWDGFATYHALWLASRTDAFSTTGVRDASGASGKFAGHQIEGRLRYWLIPHRLRAEANAAWLIKGRFLKTAPNAPKTANTSYLATSLTMSF